MSIADSVKRGLLISGPDGAIYDISFEDLQSFSVAPGDVERVILEAEQAGFVGSPTADFESCESSRDTESPVPETSSAPVINIFIGTNGHAPVVTVNEGPEDGAERAGSTMSKYAAGSTMSKYAAGSTMSKYAAGSTMSKYAAGSTMATRPADSGSVKHSAAVFYGTWE